LLPAAAAGTESLPVLADAGSGLRLTMAERDDEPGADDWFDTIRLPSIGGTDPAAGMRLARGTAAVAAGTRSTLMLPAVAARGGSACVAADGSDLVCGAAAAALTDVPSAAESSAALPSWASSDSRARRSS